MNDISDTPPALSGSLEVLHLRALLSVASDWVWQTDENLCISWLSRGALSKAGILSEHLMGKTIWDSSNMVPAFNEQWANLQSWMASRRTFQDFVICYVNESGRLVCISISAAPIFSDDGVFIGYVGLAVNLTESKGHDRGILRLQNTDPLTGSVNWKTMEEAFVRGLVIAKRKGKTLGFMMVRMPTMNTLMQQNSFAESVDLMQEVYNRIEASVRKGDVIGRLGVNDFGVLLNEIAQMEDLERIMKKVNLAFAEPFMRADKSVDIEPQSIVLNALSSGEQLNTLISIAHEKLDAQFPEYIKPKVGI